MSLHSSRNAPSRALRVVIFADRLWVVSTIAIKPAATVDRTSGGCAQTWVLAVLVGVWVMMLRGLLGLQSYRDW